MTTVTRHERFQLNTHWIFDELTGTLCPADEPSRSIYLKPIDARILGVLVRTPMYTFSRKRLFDEGWRCYGFEVCENSLNQVVCSLRASFAQLGPYAPTIRTVPRIGYCLVADVVREAPVQADMSASVSVTPAIASDYAGLDRPPRLAAREVFDAIAEQEWRRALRNHRPLSLLMVGLDRSHSGFADAASVSPVIEKVISARIHRAGDLAACYSGSEYAVLLPETDWQGSACVARDIQSSVCKPENWTGHGAMPHLVVAVGQACTAQRRYPTRDAWAEAARLALEAALCSPVTRPSMFAAAA